MVKPKGNKFADGSSIFSSNQDWVVQGPFEDPG